MQDQETRAIAAELGRCLIERRDVKAVQDNQGHYRPAGNYEQTDKGWVCTEHHPFTMTDLVDHLNGTKTYGHYVVSPEGKCRVFAFDIDLKAEGRLREWDEAASDWAYRDVAARDVWRTHEPVEDYTDLQVQLRCMAEGLALRVSRTLGIPVLVAYSGCKGMHVYGLTGSVDAGDARTLAVGVLQSFECFEPARGNAFWRHRDAYHSLEIEVFPKQDEIRSDGFGNLIRLPLGINRKSRQEGFFVDLSAPTNVLRPDDPMLALTAGSVR